MARAGGNDILAVVLWMAGALASFSASALAVRALAPAMSLVDMLAARTGGALLIVLAIALSRGERPWTARRLPLHLLRNGVHLSATLAWSYAVTIMPFALVFALEFTAPAWVTLLAILLLGEHATPTRLLAVVLGFLGVVVILRPGANAFTPSSLVMLAAAFGFAVTSITTKMLTRTQSTLSILFWMSLIQCSLSLVLGRFLPIVPAVPFEPLRHGLALAVVCLVGFTSHWCLTNAYQRGDAITVIPLDFLRLPLIALIGWQFYGEPMDPFVLVGAAVMLAGIVANLRAEALAARRAAAIAPLPARAAP